MANLFGEWIEDSPAADAASGSLPQSSPRKGRRDRDKKIQRIWKSRSCRTEKANGSGLDLTRLLFLLIIAVVDQRTEKRRTSNAHIHISMIFEM